MASDDWVSAMEENEADVYGNLLGMVASIAEYSHESITTVLEWPWRLFCAMACRMIRYNHDERRRQEERDERREMDQEEADLRRRHAQLTGQG